MQHTVEDCLPLDANGLARGGWFRGLTSGNITWTNDSSISVAFKQPHLVLVYSMDGEPVEQTIHVEAAPCHFGGVRHYFTCPGCQNRRYKLRLGGNGFYCRHCYRLPYYSQECGDLDGLIHQKHKIETKLENKTMRTSTRMRLIEQLCSAEDRVNSAFIDRFGAVAAEQFGFF